MGHRFRNQSARSMGMGSAAQWALPIVAGLVACISLSIGNLSIESTAFAAKYDTGASDTEIKIGNTIPYSGPASAYGTIGHVEAAYFKMLNDAGGVNGRKITYLSQDDGYSPPRTVEQTRKLVEEDGVLVMFNGLGTPPNSAVQKYLNLKKVPQLFVATGATKWGNYKDFPWTMGWQPNYQGEARIYAKYILANLKNPKIGVLFQNDDYGKDYYAGFKEGLGSKANLIVSEQSYEVTDPTVDSQMVNLKNSGANVFFNITTPKFAAQAIKKAAEIGWKPVHFLNNVSISIAGVMIPAGVENGQGILSSFYLKDSSDPQWANDPGMNKWRAFMNKYYPEGNQNDGNNIYGYTVAQGLVQVLKQCGDDLTRENVMRQAANLKDLELDLLLPGIKVNTSPTDFYPIEQVQLLKFVGSRWERFGSILTDR
jgi:branched-chain amino acid transport system substrate-binding protein